MMELDDNKHGVSLPSEIVDQEHNNQDDISKVTQLLYQLEQLLKTTETGSKLHGQLTSYVQQLKPLLDENNVLTETSKTLVRKANDFIKDNPALSVGLVAGASVLLTMLFNNKK